MSLTRFMNTGLFFDLSIGKRPVAAATNADEGRTRIVRIVLLSRVTFGICWGEAPGSQLRAVRTPDATEVGETSVHHSGDGLAKPLLPTSDAKMDRVDNKALAEDAGKSSADQREGTWLTVLRHESGRADSQGRQSFVLWIGPMGVVMLGLLVLFVIHLWRG